MTLSDLFPPDFAPPSLTPAQLAASRKYALSEPFRLRGSIPRKPLDVCRFEHAQYLVKYCGFTAADARRDAVETFPA